MNTLTFTYENHRGVVSERHVTPVSVVYYREPGDYSEFLTNYGPGFFMECIDHDRNDAMRTYALSRMQFAEDDDDLLVSVTGLVMLNENYRAGWLHGSSGRPVPNEIICDRWMTGYDNGRRHYLANGASGPSPRS